MLRVFYYDGKEFCPALLKWVKRKNLATIIKLLDNGGYVEKVTKLNNLYFSSIWSDKIENN